MEILRAARSVTDFVGITEVQSNIDLDEEVANEEVTEESEDQMRTNLSPEELTIYDQSKALQEMLIGYWSLAFQPAYGKIRGRVMRYEYRCPSCGEDESFHNKELDYTDEDGEVLEGFCSHCEESNPLEEWLDDEELVADTDKTPTHLELVKLGEYLGLYDAYPFRNPGTFIRDLVNEIATCNEDGYDGVNTFLLETYEQLIEEKNRQAKLNLEESSWD